MRKHPGYPKAIKSGSSTVKVYRVKHLTMASGFAYVLGWTENGIPKRKQFAVEAEAASEARRLAEMLAAGRIAGGSMGREDRDELEAARALAAPVPLLAALNEWKRINDLTDRNGIVAAEAWAARNKVGFARIKVSAAIAEFLKGKKAAGVDVKASYLRQFPALQEAFGDRLMDTLSARELQQWLDKRYPHPVSRNTARKRMVALWRWARRLGHLSRDAQTEAEQTEGARVARSTIGTIKAETYAKLLRLFRDKHPTYLGALVLAGFAGLRRSEIHGQLWSDVNLERGFLRVSAAKLNTPSHRIVHFGPAATEWFLLCSERTGAVCQNLAVDRIREVARSARFDVPENCFRHSYISHRVAMTGNVAETALEAGNSPTIIFQHYRELFTKAEGEAWFNIRPSDATGVVLEIAE